MKTDAFLENRIKWKASQEGLLKGNSYFFEDLKPKKKARFESILATADIGTPVLLFIGRRNSWTLFGTRKVISGTGVLFDGIEYSQIDKYTYGNRPFVLTSIPKDWRKFSLWFKRRHIDIVETGGRTLTLYGPKRGKWHQMHPVLLMMTRLVTKPHEQN